VLPSESDFDVDAEHVSQIRGGAFGARPNRVDERAGFGRSPSPLSRWPIWAALTGTGKPRAHRRPGHAQPWRHGQAARQEARAQRGG
jgi:hypothetical protein